MAVEVRRKSTIDFNQKVISLVEKSKEARKGLESKGDLDGGVQHALNGLIWV